MATYTEIQDYVKEKYGYTLKRCWIADIKNQFGLTTRIAYNRKSFERLYPCPENNKPHVIEALRYLGVLR